MPEDTELQLAPPDEVGNPYTKWIIASIAMVVIIAAVFLFNPHKTAEVTVQKVELYGPPTTSPTPDTVMYPGSTPPAEDDLYVVATVAITDKLRLPIFTGGTAATMVASDGTSIDANFISGADIPRLEQEYPALTPLLSRPDATPIDLGETIAPGATRVGTIVLFFPQMTEAKWKAKKSATMTINLARQTPVTVALQ